LARRHRSIPTHTERFKHQLGLVLHGDGLGAVDTRVQPAPSRGFAPTTKVRVALDVRRAVTEQCDGQVVRIGVGGGQVDGKTHVFARGHVERARVRVVDLGVDAPRFSHGIVDVAIAKFGHVCADTDQEEEDEPHYGEKTSLLILWQKNEISSCRIYDYGGRLCRIHHQPAQNQHENQRVRQKHESAERGTRGTRLGAGV